MCIFVADLEKKFYFNDQVNDNQIFFDPTTVDFKFVEISLGYFSLLEGKVTSFTLKPRFGQTVTAPMGLPFFNEYEYDEHEEEDEDEDQYDDIVKAPLLACLKRYSWQRNHTILVLKVYFSNEDLKNAYAIIIVNNKGKVLRTKMVNKKNVNYEKLVYYDLIIDEASSELKSYLTVGKKIYNYRKIDGLSRINDNYTDMCEKHSLDIDFSCNHWAKLAINYGDGTNLKKDIAIAEYFESKPDITKYEPNREWRIGFTKELNNINDNIFPNIGFDKVSIVWSK